MSKVPYSLPSPSSTPKHNLDAPARSLRPRSIKSRSERGQSTAEYALVLLGAGTIAMMVVAWASSSNQVGHLLDAVFESLIGLVT
jgi:hypothetical protein